MDAAGDVTMTSENVDMTVAQNMVLSADSITLEGGTEVLVSDGTDSYDLFDLISRRRALEAEVTDGREEREELERRVAQLEALVEKLLAHVALEREKP